MMRADTPVSVSSDEARRMAIRELSKGRYHRGSLPSAAPSAQPSTTPPAPPPHPPHVSAPSHVLTVVLIILAVLLLVFVVLLVVRRLGKPRRAQKSKQKAEKKTEKKAGRLGEEAQELLTGAALHRRDAERAAAAGDWAEAIRERFRAVIATLDERGLLPERASRTADEAARDAGAILPAHATVLAAAARAFDEVEYGEYVGTPESYAVISEVDALARTEQRGTLQLPTAIAPTVPGGAR